MIIQYSIVFMITLLIVNFAKQLSILDIMKLIRWEVFIAHFVTRIFAIIVSVISLILRFTNFGGSEAMSRRLRITIPEDLDFDGRFDDIFKNYLQRYELMQVKTCNMGTMYRLDYDVVVKPSENIKEFLDKIRERNGNLEIMLNRSERHLDEL